MLMLLSCICSLICTLLESFLGQLESSRMFAVPLLYLSCTRMKLCLSRCTGSRCSHSIGPVRVSYRLQQWQHSLESKHVCQIWICISRCRSRQILLWSCDWWCWENQFECCPDSGTVPHLACASLSAFSKLALIPSLASWSRLSWECIVHSLEPLSCFSFLALTNFVTNRSVPKRSYMDAMSSATSQRENWLRHLSHWHSLQHILQISLKKKCRLWFLEAQPTLRSAIIDCSASHHQRNLVWECKISLKLKSARIEGYPWCCQRQRSNGDKHCALGSLWLRWAARFRLGVDCAHHIRSDIIHHQIDCALFLKSLVVHSCRKSLEAWGFLKIWGGGKLLAWSHWQLWWSIFKDWGLTQNWSHLPTWWSHMSSMRQHSCWMGPLCKIWTYSTMMAGQRALYWHTSIIVLQQVCIQTVDASVSRGHIRLHLPLYSCMTSMTRRPGKIHGKIYDPQECSLGTVPYALVSYLSLLNNNLRRARYHRVDIFGSQISPVSINTVCLGHVFVSD